ncbi:proactivator polypeptide [Acrasis kona]|uniref:Proactivator polypeptide n=1 Tax=Acrasis kona TaxID=1008807 RepID=A0AAW2ZJP4_9EUKA
MIKFLFVALIAAALVSATEVAPQPRNDASTCALCTFFVTSVESYLQTNTTVLQMEALLNKICFALPDAVQPQCLMMVAQLPELVKYIESQYTPAAVCKMVKLCDDNNAPVPKPASNDAQTCALCTFGVDSVEQYLSQNSTQQEIVTRLTYVCQLAPQVARPSCDYFVQQIPAVVKYIEAEYPAKKVCQLMRLCDANGRPFKLSLASLKF